MQLAEQLAVGGAIVAPLGPAGAEQKLTKVVKNADGSLSGEGE